VAGRARRFVSRRLNRRRSGESGECRWGPIERSSRRRRSAFPIWAGLVNGNCERFDTENHCSGRPWFPRARVAGALYGHSFVLLNEDNADQRGDGVVIGKDAGDWVLRLLSMAGPSRQRTISHAAESPARCLLGGNNSEFLEEPLARVDEPPAHDAMNNRDLTQPYGHLGHSAMSA
jgi:hypothetical protein